jgi:hypothetical protein
MMSFPQRVRAGMLLSRLHDRRAFVRVYLSLLLKIAPRKYGRLLKAKNAAGVLCVALALCAVARR